MARTAEYFRELVDGRRRGPVAATLRAGLWWARFPYGLGAALRDRAFRNGWKRSVRAAVPIVCVGNLSLGGTGKTPCVEYVAGFFRDLGASVAILSRGYGAANGPNDEAMLLEENLPDVPHLQGADRAALAAVAVEELERDLLVLDDGFQHRRLARDLDIVLVDATRPLAREYLFPRGMLREPVAALRRASVVVLTRCDQVSAESLAAQIEHLRRRFPRLSIATAKHDACALDGSPLPEPAQWRSRPVAAFCGLGNPAAFRATLQTLGAEPTELRTYPDHHNYSREDVEELRRWAASLPLDAWIATTQKDWVKLRLDDLDGRRLIAVRARFQFVSDEAEFQERLRQAWPGAVPAPAIAEAA